MHTTVTVQSFSTEKLILTFVSPFYPYHHPLRQFHSMYFLDSCSICHSMVVSYILQMLHLMYLHSRFGFLWPFPCMISTPDLTLVLYLGQLAYRSNPLWTVPEAVVWFIILFYFLQVIAAIGIAHRKAAVRPTGCCVASCGTSSSS